MKFLLTCLFVFISFIGFSQIRTRVIWLSTDGKPTTNYVHYTTNKLTWSDFQAKPGPPSEIGAITMSGFGYRSKLSGTAQNGLMEIEVYSFMDPAGSWVRPDKKNNYVLNHEQRHFDITHLHAKKFAERAKDLKFTPNNYEKLIGDLYKQVNDELRNMQRAYDMETNPGTV